MLDLGIKSAGATLILPGKAGRANQDPGRLMRRVGRTDRRPIAVIVSASQSLASTCPLTPKGPLRSSNHANAPLHALRPADPGKWSERSLCLQVLGAFFKQHAVTAGKSLQHLESPV